MSFLTASQGRCAPPERSQKAGFKTSAAVRNRVKRPGQTRQLIDITEQFETAIAIFRSKTLNFRRKRDWNVRNVIRAERSDVQTNRGTLTPIVRTARTAAGSNVRNVNRAERSDVRRSSWSDASGVPERAVSFQRREFERGKSSSAHRRVFARMSTGFWDLPIGNAASVRIELLSARHPSRKSDRVTEAARWSQKIGHNAGY